jgi:hypothetical protein
MLIIYDLVRKRDEHGTLNEPVIQSILKINVSKNFILSSDSSCVKYFYGENKKILTTVSVKDTRFYRWVSSNIKLIRFVTPLLFKIDIKIIFTSLLPFQYFFVALISRFFSIKFLIFMHGELGYLVKPKGTGQIIGKYFILSAFKLLNQNRVQLVAIGLPIATNLIFRFPYLKNIITIELPPNGDSFRSVEIKKNNSIGTKKIGIFGTLSSSKNSEKIYELASKIKWRDLNITGSLCTIGLSDGSFHFGASKHVEHVFRGNLGEDHISWDIFSSEFQKLDAALFFYDTSKNYSLIPSGVLYDCIHWGIPILSLGNDNFSLYFKKYGDLGIIAKNINELSDFASLILSNNLNLDYYKFNLNIAKTDMSLKNFEDKLFSFAFNF